MRLCQLIVFGEVLKVFLSCGFLKMERVTGRFVSSFFAFSSFSFCTEKFPLFELDLPVTHLPGTCEYFSQFLFSVESFSCRSIIFFT